MTMKITTRESISIIGKEISLYEKSTFSQEKKGQRIEFNKQNKIFFLSKGEVSIYRSVDHLQTIHLCAPAIIGLTQLHSEDLTHYLRCDKVCDMWAIGISEAASLFNESNLWPYVFNSLSYLMQEYFKREYMISQKTSYGVVYQHLKYIWSMDTTIRKKTSLYKFILSRNHISRSAVHKVISQMVDNGIIETQRGKLIKMQPDIPYQDIA